MTAPAHPFRSLLMGIVELVVLGGLILTLLTVGCIAMMTATVWRRMNKHQKNPINLKQYCTCEYSQIREGTTVSEGDVTYTTDDGRAWKLVKLNPDCSLHADDPRYDLPDGLL